MPLGNVCQYPLAIDCPSGFQGYTECDWLDTMALFTTLSRSVVRCCYVCFHCQNLCVLHVIRSLFWHIFTITQVMVYGELLNAVINEGSFPLIAKATRSSLRATFIQSQYLKALAASLRVGFCDEWKKGLRQRLIVRHTILVYKFCNCKPLPHRLGLGLNRKRLVVLIIASPIEDHRLTFERLQIIIHYCW